MRSAMTASAGRRSWTVKIRPIRVLDITGDGFNFDIAQGILYAAGLPATGAGGALVQAPSRAPIINMSLGGPSPSTTLRNAVNAANAAGSLIVASAGNDGLDINSYPAAFPDVMGVSSVGMDGGLATYSNGGTFISVAAPGGDFRFDDNGGGGVLGPGWNFSTGKAEPSVRLRNVGIGAVRVRHRGAAARADADAHRGATAPTHRAVRDASRRALREATCSAGES